MMLNIYTFLWLTVSQYKELYLFILKAFTRFKDKFTYLELKTWPFLSLFFCIK